MSRYEILQASDEQTDIVLAEEKVEVVEASKGSVEKINNVAQSIFEILEADLGTKRREVINHYGPYLFALATELNASEGEFVNLLEALRLSEGGFFDAMVRMVGKYDNDRKRIGFATPSKIIEENELEIEEVYGYSGKSQLPTRLSSEGEYSNFVQAVIERMYGGSEDKMGVFEQEGPVIMAIMLVHGRNLQKVARSLLNLGQAVDFAEAMSRMAQDDGGVMLTPAVGRSGVYWARRLRTPLCVDENSGR